MKYFCLKRSKGVYDEFFPLHLDSTANFVLVEVPWSELHCYCSNPSWQFAKCHYLMTQHRVLAKKPTPSTLEGKVSPAIQKYAEMYLGKWPVFLFSTSHYCFWTNWRQFSHFYWAMAFDNHDSRAFFSIGSFLAWVYNEFHVAVRLFSNRSQLMPIDYN